jgi:DNA replication protein DnaC
VGEDRMKTTMECPECHGTLSRDFWLDDRGIEHPGWPSGNSARRFVRDCQPCRRKDMLERRGQRVSGQIVTLETLHSFKTDAKIIAEAKASAQHPRPLLLVGRTGAGKSLLMRLLFNELVNRGEWPTWLTEYDLWTAFTAERDEAVRVFEQAAKSDFIFLDELFHPSHWHSREGHNANLFRGSFSHLLETLYQRKDRIVVIASSNQDPKTLLDDAQFRRMREICRTMMVLQNGASS